MRLTRPQLLLALIGTAAVVAAIVIVVAVFSTGGSPPSSPTTTATAPGGPFTAGPVDVLKGVPQHGDTLGEASATTTLEVFEDPQCPYCREWALESFPTVVQRYVRTGRIKLVYRGVEIIGPNSEPGLRAIYASGGQNKLWNLVEELYTRQGKENSGWITDAVLRSAATAVGADPGPVLARSSSAAVTDQLHTAASEFRSYGLQGTPSFVLQRPLAVPRQLQVTGLDPASFTSALDAALPQ